MDGKKKTRDRKLGILKVLVISTKQVNLIRKKDIRLLTDTDSDVQRKIVLFMCNNYINTEDEL